MCNIFRKRLEGKIHQVDDSGTSENERHKGWFFTLSLVMSVFISWNFQWNSIHLITHVINFLKAEKNGAYWRFWILIVLNSMLESKHLLLFFFFLTFYVLETAWIQFVLERRERYQLLPGLLCEELFQSPLSQTLSCEYNQCLWSAR